MMKTNLLLMLGAMMLTFSSCRIELGDRISPSANIVQADYAQAPFDEVNSYLVGRVQLVQSDKSLVTVSAPENYINYIKIKNRNGKLEIGFAEKNISLDADDIVVTIYTPTLKEIENGGAGDVRMDSLHTDELEVRNSGVGSFTLNRVTARKIDVSCTGVGSINMNGETDEAEYSCSGVGGIQAKDMISRETKATISGVGGIDCYASEYIEGSVTGVGGLRYAGKPEKKDLHHTMTGGISEL